MHYKAPDYGKELFMPVVGAIMVPHPPIIIPAVGKGEEEKIRKTAESYKKAAEFAAGQSPETIVIISPHHTMYADYFTISSGAGASGSLSQFGAPGARAEIRYDEELRDGISEICGRRNFPAGTLGQKTSSLDHGTVIPLLFLQEAVPGLPFQFLRIGLSGLPLTDHYRLGQIIREASDKLDRRVFIIASGDLSHKLKEDGPYGFNPAGPEYDKRIMDVMGKGDFGGLFDFSPALCNEAAECGHRSFVIMAGTFDGTAVRAEALSHEDVFGVGYGVATFLPWGDDPSRHFLTLQMTKEKAALERRKSAEDGFVRLARKALETYITRGKRLKIPDDLPDGLGEDERKSLTEERAGAFVSLHEEGNLRGCIGTISPVHKNLAVEICENAVSAATRDTRFPPVKISELDRLEYSVDVLEKPEPVSSKKDLNPSEYGVIVTKGGRRGLLLPDLEGVDTADEQISIAKRKAGIGKWETGVKLERFRVTRHV